MTASQRRWQVQMYTKKTFLDEVEQAISAVIARKDELVLWRGRDRIRVGPRGNGLRSRQTLLEVASTRERVAIRVDNKKPGGSRFIMSVSLELNGGLQPLCHVGAAARHL